MLVSENAVKYLQLVRLQGFHYYLYFIYRQKNRYIDKLKIKKLKRNPQGNPSTQGEGRRRLEGKETATNIEEEKKKNPPAITYTQPKQKSSKADGP